MPLSLLLNGLNARFGIDGGAISTYRSSAYLERASFNRPNAISINSTLSPPASKPSMRLSVKSSFPTPLQTGLDTLTAK